MILTNTLVFALWGGLILRNFDYQLRFFSNNVDGLYRGLWLFSMLVSGNTDGPVVPSPKTLGKIGTTSDSTNNVLLLYNNSGNLVL